MILIDFGKLHPPAAGQKFGRYDWSISINDSWWEMSKKDNVIVGNGDTEVEIDKKIKQILGKTIVNIQYLSRMFWSKKLIFQTINAGEINMHMRNNTAKNPPERALSINIL